ncbi:hypothetical protein XI25_29410 [Paenibacillus sp. DMB20]|nr:hypothetical protein XI25_29410 [Paenibacillus sp. DMB20]
MKQLKVIEKNNQRVLTSAQLAEFFGTDSKTISYNFNYNRERFQEGKHFFVLTGEARKEFLFNYREIHDSSKHAKSIYLWTEKGAFMLAKSLNTDKAWDAYSALVDDYFNKVERLQSMNVPTEVPTTIEGILELAVLNMKDLRTELNAVKQENHQLRLVVDNEIWLTDHQKASIQEAVNKRVGKLKSKGYDAHFQGIYRALKDHFSVPNYSKIKRIDFERALEIIAGWFPKKKDEAI